jgi:vacuolar-type H+-ATPase subunit F/Vma7
MRVVALGPEPEIAGFALAGVRVVAVTTADEVRAAWRHLGEEVGLVLLSAETAEVLADVLHERPTTLTAVTP